MSKKLNRCASPVIGRRGFITAAVLVALGGLLFGALEVQVWVFVVVPAIALVAFPQRYLLRQVLHRKRAKEAENWL